MRYFFFSLRLTLKSRLRRKGLWLLTALVLSGGLALHLFPVYTEDAVVTVAVVLPEEGGEDFWERLTLREDRLVHFVPATAPEAEKNVSASRWDCALVLAEDFKQQLTAGDY